MAGAVAVEGIEGLAPLGEVVPEAFEFVGVDFAVAFGVKHGDHHAAGFGAEIGCGVVAQGPV